MGTPANSKATNRPATNSTMRKLCTYYFRSAEYQHLLEMIELDAVKIDRLISDIDVLPILDKYKTSLKVNILSEKGQLSPMEIMSITGIPASTVYGHLKSIKQYSKNLISNAFYENINFKLNRIYD